MYRYVVGVDEVGRGPLAGPLGVCALVAQPDFFAPYIFIKDSKQISAVRREAIVEELLDARKKGRVNFSVAYTSHTYIDRFGMTKAIQKAVQAALVGLDLEPENSLILLDGSLEAPGVFAHQRTIIGGDAKEPAIALASIVAKVDRDRRMVRLAKKYPGYGFETHKGYGTKAHREAIRQLGPAPIHRRLFLRKMLVG